MIDSALAGVDNDWLFVGGGAISPDGKFALYSIDSGNHQHHMLVIQPLSGDWKETFQDAGNAQFTTHGQLVFKSSGDSLWVLNLNGKGRQFLGQIRSCQLIGKGEDERLLYQLKDSTVIIRDMQGGREFRFVGVQQYILNKQKTVLLLQRKVSGQLSLSYVNLKTGDESVFWKGKAIGNYVFDKEGSKFSFFVDVENKEEEAKWELWNYEIGNRQAEKLVDDETSSRDTSLILNGKSELKFSRTGGFIFFQLFKNEQSAQVAEEESAKVDIWHYRNEQPASGQWKQKPPPVKGYWAAAEVTNKRVIKIQQRPDERVILFGETPDEQVVIYASGNATEAMGSEDNLSMYIESLATGKRRLVMDHTEVNHYLNYFSTDGCWMVWFDEKALAWYSYDTNKGQLINISSKIPYPLYNENKNDLPQAPPSYKNILDPVGFIGWLEGERDVLLYDDYDIWQVDVEGIEAPVNLTRGFGRKNHIKFRVISNLSDAGKKIFTAKDTLLLSAFNSSTKENGFFRMQVGLSIAPERLYMTTGLISVDPSQLDRMATGDDMKYPVFQKAANANVWLVTRQSEAEAPNYYYTYDFKSFIPLTNINPQKEYNWLTSELVHFPMPDLKQGTGILCKPENFDAKKKYPVIFYYYEQRSDRLHQYLTPKLSEGDIDIPYFVSRGYLVFIPDIHYRIGQVGQSALETVTAAANYLKKISWIDGNKIGLNGHSHGGYETNYIVTHSSLFAAAAESAGVVDLIGIYNTGGINNVYYEHWQGRMGATLWQQPEWYISGSPIFYANKVVAPILILHNRNDYAVPYAQGVEFFNALQRLNKKSWMLQYDGGNHGSLSKDAAKDYTRRLLQFFDHYLKDQPAPKWMTHPELSGPDRIQEGFELDSSGNCGPDCKVCKKWNQLTRSKNQSVNIKTYPHETRQTQKNPEAKDRETPCKTNPVPGARADNAAGSASPGSDRAHNNKKYQYIHWQPGHVPEN